MGLIPRLIFGRENSSQHFALHLLSLRRLMQEASNHSSLSEQPTMKTRSIILTLALTTLTFVACGKKSEEPPATDTTKKDTMTMPAPAPMPTPTPMDTAKADSAMKPDSAAMKHDDHDGHDHGDKDKGAAAKSTAKPSENKPAESETRRPGQNTAKESEVRRGGSTNSSQESSVRRTPSSSNSSSQESSVRRNP
ncbi:MAG: hypothetical protein UZ07_CHB004002733 [Chlorobi bacterium OLB7]|nr:MAG: hypothetical protein UZ07_CHB004002733 [Chlorobi bacterium OLB7]